MNLVIENLSKRYPKHLALSNVNISLEAGVYGLLGENGAGKSTLMRILSTIDRQTSGSVKYNGENILALDEEYRNILGYVPQDFGVHYSFTATDFLKYVGTLKGIERRMLEAKIDEVLLFVNLNNVANKKVAGFSGGMKRRLGIAQAILNDPKILILDEPTAGLDPKERLRFSNIISEMAKDKIVILSTHIISDIEAIASNLVILKDGSVVVQDEISSLLDTMNSSVYEATVTQMEFNEILANRKIVHRKQEKNHIKVRYVGEEYEDIQSILQKPALEDYYVFMCY